MGISFGGIVGICLSLIVIAATIQVIVIMFLHVRELLRAKSSKKIDRLNAEREIKQLSVMLRSLVLEVESSNLRIDLTKYKIYKIY